MERKFELGMASYTLRKIKLDEAIAMTRRVGLKNIALKDFHLPMNATADEIKAVAAKVKDAGLNLYGCGVVYMRSQADVDRAFEYARTAGMTTIIGVLNHDLLPLVDKKVKEYDIAVAIHNHGPGDKVYPTPESVYEKVKDLDPRIGLCMDIGHTVRIGEDPIRDTMRFADRLLDVHIKDVSAAEAKGSTVEIGRGIIDIPGFIRASQNRLCQIRLFRVREGRKRSDARPCGIGRLCQWCYGDHRQSGFHQAKAAACAGASRNRSLPVKNL